MVNDRELEQLKIGKDDIKMTKAFISKRSLVRNCIDKGEKLPETSKSWEEFLALAKEVIKLSNSG